MRQVEPDDIWHSGFLKDRPGGLMPSAAAPWRDELLAEHRSGRESSQHFFTPEVFIPWLEAGGRVHHPDGARLRRSGDLHRQPVPRPLPRWRNSRPKGYAGLSNQKAAEVAARYVIVDTIAQAIQSGDAAGAVQQAEAQLQRIYGS